MKTENLYGTGVLSGEWQQNRQCSNLIGLLLAVDGRELECKLVPNYHTEQGPHKKDHKNKYLRRPVNRRHGTWFGLKNYTKTLNFV